MFKILCVEDDLALAEELKTALVRYEYDVHLALEFTQIDVLVKSINPHLILMDVNLPYHSGFHWCERIRTFSNVPILFISSRDERLDQVIAMTLGGDDYLTKPLDLEITLIKIQAILRRTYSYDTEVETTKLIYQGLQLDLKTMNLLYQGKSETLTKNEFKIIQCLMQEAGNFVARTRLMDFLWEQESFIDDNALNVNLSRIRRKLENLIGQDWIETKRGVGYRVHTQGS